MDSSIRSGYEFVLIQIGDPIDFGCLDDAIQGNRSESLATYLCRNYINVLRVYVKNLEKKYPYCECLM